MNRSMIVAALVVAALVVAAVATNGFGLAGDGDEEELVLYGNVDIREVDMAFRVPGRIETIPVEEGDTVEEGAALATLDTSTTADRVAEADARIAQSEARLRRLRNGNRPEDIAQARARLSAAEAQLANASADVERREGLVESGAISRDAWDQTLTVARQAEAQVREAQAAYALVRNGARPEDIDAAAAELEAARAMRASAATDLDDTTLTAPLAATVITRAAEPGSYVQPGEPVITLSIADPVRVRAYVSEPDLSRVRPGMKVTIRADGIDREFTGTIGYISPRAEFTPRTVETEDLRTDLVYRLRIIVEDASGALRQGQPVTVVAPDAPARGAD